MKDSGGKEHPLPPLIFAQLLVVCRAISRQRRY